MSERQITKTDLDVMLAAHMIVEAMDLVKVFFLFHLQSGPCWPDRQYLGITGAVELGTAPYRGVDGDLWRRGDCGSH